MGISAGVSPRTTLKYSGNFTWKRSTGGRSVFYEKMGFESHGLEKRALRVVDRYLDEEFRARFSKGRRGVRRSTGRGRG